MHISSSLCLLFLSTFINVVSTLPFSAQNRDTQQIKQKRVPYSVVPVNGGSTVITTQAETVTKTVTVSPTTVDALTATVVSTVLLSEAAAATTILITISGGYLTTTSASTSPSFSIVNPSQPTETVVIPVIGPGPISISSSSGTASLSQPPTPFLPDTTSTLSASTPTTPSILSTIYISIFEPSTTISYGPQLTSTTKTYDNGLWHTTYPSWNATYSTTSTSGTLLPTAFAR